MQGCFGQGGPISSSQMAPPLAGRTKYTGSAHRGHRALGPRSMVGVEVHLNREPTDREATVGIENDDHSSRLTRCSETQTGP